MLRPEVCHIFRTERPTNFKLGVQMEDEDPYRRDGPSPARSEVKIAILLTNFDVSGTFRSRLMSDAPSATASYKDL